MFQNIFANISAQGGPFFKPIFALKPWSREIGIKANSVSTGVEIDLQWCYDTTRTDTTRTGHNPDRHNPDRHNPDRDVTWTGHNPDRT